MYVEIWMDCSDFVSLCKENTVKILWGSSLHKVIFDGDLTRNNCDDILEKQTRIGQVEGVSIININ